MAHIDASFLEINSLDALSRQNTAIHRLDPRAKVLTALIFVVAVVSVDKYEVSGLLPFILYPVVLIALGNLPPGRLLRKILLAAPFAVLIGIFNPLLDRAVLVQMGPLGISGGWISFASILVRFALTVSAALILVATTGFNGVCAALERMRVPKVFVVQLLFLYRYLFVLVEEASRLSRARSLRSFDGKGMGLTVFSSMIGQLLLRSFDRAQRIHRAMLCRGFDGEIRTVRALRFRAADLGFLLGWTLLFIAMRLSNIPAMIGGAITELAK